MTPYSCNIGLLVLLTPPNSNNHGHIIHRSYHFKPKFQSPILTKDDACQSICPPIRSPTFTNFTTHSPLASVDYKSIHLPHVQNFINPSNRSRISGDCKFQSPLSSISFHVCSTSAHEGPLHGFFIINALTYFITSSSIIFYLLIYHSPY